MYELILFYVRSLDDEMTMSGFEQASQPTLSDVDRRKLLNFCIVGTRLAKAEVRFCC